MSIWALVEGLAADYGKAVQVGPIKAMLKAPGYKRLKLNYDVLLSTFAFKVDLRRYIMDRETGRSRGFAFVTMGTGLHSSTLQLNLC